MDKITDRIETFEDVVQVAIELGYIKAWRNKSEDETIDEYAYRQIKLISKVLNEGWEPDWSDYFQYKWVLWFGYKSGVGLSYYDFDNWFSLTYVGSRFCYKSAGLAKFAGQQFENIYLDFLTIKH